MKLSDIKPFLVDASEESSFDSKNLYLCMYKEMYELSEYHLPFEINAFIDHINENFEKAEILSKKYTYAYYDNDTVNLRKVLDFAIIKLEEKVFFEFNTYHKVCFVYDKNIDITKYIDILYKLKLVEKFTNKFSVILDSKYSDNGLDLKEFDIREIDINIESNYNDDFVRVNEKIINFLNNDSETGLVLLHGKQGTGKTSYIRHLINHIDKKFVYLPVQMASYIDNPNLMSFMSKNISNSILIIEDCEELIKSREGKDFVGSGISNLLNLSDGLLSDAFKIKIICTFNTDLSNIDKAILRKGRLKAKYEFSDLNKEKVGALLRSLGIKNVESKSMTLAEVYNLKENNFHEEEKKKIIGFKTNGKENYNKVEL